jgi:hypothetical protein
MATAKRSFVTLNELIKDTNNHLIGELSDLRRKLVEGHRDSAIDLAIQLVSQYGFTKEDLNPLISYCLTKYFKRQGLNGIELAVLVPHETEELLAILLPVRRGY